MIIELSIKNKIGFIDESISKPTNVDPTLLSLGSK